MKIRVLSLFDGISVGMLALKRAGFDVEKYYASEIKTKAMKCSFNNWGDAIEQIGDVRIDCIGRTFQESNCQKIGI